MQCSIWHILLIGTIAYFIGVKFGGPGQSLLSKVGL